MLRKITIAVDGYSSCGKSTLAKAMAEKLKYVYIDSGAMYRAITYYALTKGYFDNHLLDTDSLISDLPHLNISFIYHPDTHLGETMLNGKNIENQIRTMEVSKLVSTISKIPEVRHQLVKIQQQLGADKGVVMDGRDIGTVVFPKAELKLFLTAKADVRAKRRMLELKEKGQHAAYEEVLENLNHRDFEDTHRAIDPLVQADDALLLDNSNLTREEQLNHCLNLVQNLIGEKV